jgi:peptidoglycan L-alanyl-D-glutamate endopeptidase CwlK
MTDRDRARLVGIYPQLVAILEDVFAELAAAGTPMFVVVGLRTVADQQADYAKGRTAPGPIVTMCDGVRHPSPHQVKADGFGHAVDSAFIGPDPFALTHPWEAYGEALEARGLTWGGRFSHPVDLDHAELP